MGAVSCKCFSNAQVIQSHQKARLFPYHQMNQSELLDMTNLGGYSVQNSNMNISQGQYTSVKETKKKRPFIRRRSSYDHSMSINADNKQYKQDSIEEFLSELNHQEEEKLEIMKKASTQVKQKNAEERKQVNNQGNNKKSIINSVFDQEFSFQRINTQDQNFAKLHSILKKSPDGHHQQKEPHKSSSNNNQLHNNQVDKDNYVNNNNLNKSDSFSKKKAPQSKGSNNHIKVMKMLQDYEIQSSLKNSQLISSEQDSSGSSNWDAPSGKNDQKLKKFGGMSEEERPKVNSQIFEKKNSIDRKKQTNNEKKLQSEASRDLTESIDSSEERDLSSQQEELPMLNVRVHQSQRPQTSNHKNKNIRLMEPKWERRQSKATQLYFQKFTKKEEDQHKEKPYLIQKSQVSNNHQSNGSSQKDESSGNIAPSQMSMQRMSSPYIIVHKPPEEQEVQMSDVASSLAPISNYEFIPTEAPIHKRRLTENSERQKKILQTRGQKKGNVLEYGRSIQNTSDNVETISQASIKQGASNASGNVKLSPQIKEGNIQNFSEAARDLYRLEGNQFVSLDTNKVVFRLKQKKGKDSNTNHSSANRQSSASEKGISNISASIEHENSMTSKEKQIKRANQSLVSHGNYQSKSFSIPHQQPLNPSFINSANHALNRMLHQNSVTPKIMKRLGTLNEAQEEEEKGSNNDNTNSLNFGTKSSFKFAQSSYVISDKQPQRNNSSEVNSIESFKDNFSSIQKKSSSGDPVVAPKQQHQKSRQPILETVLESAEATTINQGKKLRITANDLPVIKESQEGISRDKGTSLPYPISGYGGVTYEQNEDFKYLRLQKIQGSAYISQQTIEDHIKKQKLVSQTKGIIKLIRENSQNRESQAVQFNPAGSNYFEARRSSAPSQNSSKGANIQESKEQATPTQNSRSALRQKFFGKNNIKAKGEIPAHILQFVQNQTLNSSFHPNKLWFEQRKLPSSNQLNNPSLNLGSQNLNLREFNEQQKLIQYRNSSINKSPNLIKRVRENISITSAIILQQQKNQPAILLDEPQQSQQFEISNISQRRPNAQLQAPQKMSFNSEAIMTYQQIPQDFDSISRQIYNSEHDQEMTYDELNDDGYDIEMVEDDEEEEDISQSGVSRIDNTNSRTETTLKNTISDIKQKTASPTPSNDLQKILGSLQPVKNNLNETPQQKEQSSQSNQIMRTDHVQSSYQSKPQDKTISSITNTIVSSPDGTMCQISSPETYTKAMKQLKAQESGPKQMMSLKPAPIESPVLSSEDEEGRIRNLDKLFMKMSEQYEEEESKRSISLSPQQDEKDASPISVPFRKMTYQMDMTPKSFLTPNFLTPMNNIEIERRKTIVKTPSQMQSLLTPANLQRLDSSDGTSQRSMDSRSVTTTNNLKSSRKNGHKKINQYIRHNQIGKGAFSKVYRCISETDGQEYAMKIINKKKQSMKINFNYKKPYNFVDNEVAILRKMNHENVFQLFEIIDDPKEDKLYIITEFVRNGTLEGRVNKKPEQLQMSDIRKYFLGLIHAIEYCHDCASVMHRDIKLENILLDENDQVKLADFGVSQMMQENGDDRLKEKAGTQFYFCPEMCQGKEYRGKPADVWACGIVLYYMATKKFPFTTNNSFGQELYRKIITEEPDYSEIEDARLLDLLKGILKKDPNKRLKIPQIKMHAWTTDSGIIQIKRFDSKKIEVTENDLKQVITNIIKVKQFVNQLKRKSLLKLKSNNNPIQLNKPVEPQDERS